MKTLAILLALATGFLMAHSAPAFARRHHHVKTENTAPAKTDDAAAAKPSDDAAAAPPATGTPAATGAPAGAGAPVATAAPAETGQNALPTVNATLQLGRDYYLMSGDSAHQFLGDSGADGKNPQNILGVIVPTGKSASDTPWYGVVTFDQSGWVSDEAITGASLAEVVAQAQPPGTLEPVWLMPPVYDPSHHTLIWGQPVAPGSQSAGGIDFEIRVLGRAGVLGISIMCPQSSLADVQTAAPILASAVSFGPGARYEDYQAGKDPKASFGVADIVTSYLGASADASAQEVINAFDYGTAPLKAKGKTLRIVLIVVLLIAGAWIGRFHRLFRRS